MYALYCRGRRRSHTANRRIPHRFTRRRHRRDIVVCGMCEGQLREEIHARHRAGLPRSRSSYRSLGAHREARSGQQPRQALHTRVRSSLHLRLRKGSGAAPQRHPFPSRRIQDADDARQEDSPHHPRCRVQQFPPHHRHRQRHLHQPSSQKGRQGAHHRRCPCRLHGVRPAHPGQESHHRQRASLHRRRHHRSRPRVPGVCEGGQELLR